MAHLLQVLRLLQPNAPKGQAALSPGHRTGYKDVIRFALKGQKPYLAFHAFALTGRGADSKLPRALPWAGSLLAFQAVVVQLEKLEILYLSHRFNH